ncbi:1-acyl-sn-glycerol-3-phosphate acyltransferase [Aquicoccus sp. SCR17]|nr:1-acyl-sn-glycerol-3-phosphate acyltransferase [Carideicomes alvinocaridis]
MRPYPLQWLLSLLFIVQMYVAMGVLGLIYLPRTLLRQEGAYDAVHAYCRWVRWTLKILCGLRTEVRGPVPQDEVMIAAKHQSFLDIIMIVSVVPRPKFIMKASLVYAPVLGWYALKLGCVPVNRGRRSEAIRKMVRDVTHGDAPAGQLIIYPQGTRAAPGAMLPYKGGTAALYAETGQPCVPAAANVGLFWPRHGIYRKPGLAVVEFLPRMAPGMQRQAFMAELEQVIEGRSNALMAEAGFNVQKLD